MPPVSSGKQKMEAGRSRGPSQFLSRRRAKHQAPNPKLRRSSKSQTPNHKNRCRGKRRAGRFLSLELGASLELGVWNLELVAWALSLSKIEMPPRSPREYAPQREQSIPPSAQAFLLPSLCFTECVFPIDCGYG